MLDSLRDDPEHAGIFLDFDGTLAPIVPRPEDAAPLPGTAEVLGSLARRYACVAVLSGRSLDDLRGRLEGDGPLDGVLLLGAYGRERSDRPGRRPTEGWEPVAAAAAARVRGFEGVFVERKGTGVALHFRLAPHREAEVRQIARSLASAFGLEERPGRRVVELVAPGPGKGDAVETVVREKGLRSVLVAGDDLADAEAFERVRTLGLQAVLVAVASDEAPPELLGSAHLVLEGPNELLELLRSLGMEQAQAPD